jgi:hypothetical protein
VSTQSQSLIKYEAELAQLRGKVTSLTADTERKDRLLLSRDQAIAEIRVQLSSDRHKAVEDDPTEKLALKVTCHFVTFLFVR